MSYQLTQEQQNIINYDGNMVINAVAGSGKTTTLVEFAKAKRKIIEQNRTNPFGTPSILYLAFNRSVANHAEKAFQGLTDTIEVRTIHSLALRGTGYRAPQNKPTSNKELLKKLGLDEEYQDRFRNAVNNEEKKALKTEQRTILEHVQKFHSFYCNSAVSEFKDLDYLETIKKDEVHKFVNKHYELIQRYAEKMFRFMERNFLPINHDFYLKKYQLSNPKLNYKYILLDEAQDVSPVMLDIFVKQENAIKVAVGDINQQIYGWRFAKNALKELPYEEFSLTNSFRFDQNIADLANYCLNLKKQMPSLANFNVPEIKGVANYDNQEIKTKAILARKNSSIMLLVLANLEHIEGKMFFEGGVNERLLPTSIMFTESGISLYDVFNLWNKNHANIKNEDIKEMETFEELKEYVAKAEDNELKDLIDHVERHKENSINIIYSIQNKITRNRDEASVIFSTLHKAKGMEYDLVYISGDFISENKVLNKNSDPATEEEINLLYVAVTRAKKLLKISSEIMPNSFREEKRENIEVWE